ncbi:conserved unknown protein [Ectocarpus siliculosus]|uniref:Protein kinase domain-containing protein n=1 Tax=Ectocarpus siliculosus TaxID=2880 RepID=D8LF86_ECTSI|nr:conserved unknown protein [Ectocarpus siliculosus]|eukprot:CBN78811.1 conserved unknown protein [Ectocarpus siliculosus]
MNTAARAPFRGAGLRRALHKAGSRAFPGAAPAGGGRGAGGGSRRQLASMSLLRHHDHEPYVGFGLLASLGLVILSGYSFDDELPSRLLEKLQQQTSSASAVWPLRSIDEFYTVRSDETLGRGQFGTVTTATDKATGEVVAVKCVPRSEASESHFREETDVHREVASHPNVVGVKGVYADEDCWYLVMELAEGGELFDRLTTEGLALDDGDVRSLLRDTAEAIAFLHEHSIVHGDVKPENMLLTAAATGSGDDSRRAGDNQISEEAAVAQKEQGAGEAGGSVGKVLLADFGSSFRLRGGRGHKRMKEYTIAYSAPEVVENSAEVDQKADMWSLGVIAYVLVVGHHPFDPTSEADDEEITESILHSEPDWDGVEPKAATLIRRMLSRNPEDRPSAREVLQNSWLQQL